MTKRFLAVTLLAALSCSGVGWWSNSGSKKDPGQQPPPLTIYNDPANNIFDSADPLCDGTDASIVFCDGFEDGFWWCQPYDPTGPPYTGNGAYPYGCGLGVPANDYWYQGNISPNRDPYCYGSGCTVESGGGNYAACGDPDTDTLSVFGARGTTCTGTQGWPTFQAINWDGSAWLHFASFSHWMTGNPVTDSGQFSLQAFSYRMFIKFADTTSRRCPGGPPCPSWQWNNTNNGFKFTEWMPTSSGGGIYSPNFATRVNNDVGSPWRETFSFGGICEQTAMGSDPECQGGGYAQESQLYQNSPPNTLNEAENFNWKDHINEWIGVEIVIDYTTNPGKVEFYMDACGFDGKSCPPTQTLVLSYNQFDLTPVTSTTFRGVWQNAWCGSDTGGCMAAELQIDEIVVRDRTVTNANIGW